MEKNLKVQMIKYSQFLGMKEKLQPRDSRLKISKARIPKSKHLIFLTSVFTLRKLITDN